MDGIPKRVVNLDRARAETGDLIDRVAPWFWVADPLADAAVAALERDRAWPHVEQALRQGVDAVPGASAELRALFRQLDTVPVWVDRDRVRRAGRILFRALAVGGIVLGARSLPAGYCSPAGNKPLVLTGRLASPDQGRRLAETGRFVSAVCEQGGLERGGAGFALCVHVRLMHAKVRWLIGRTDRWDRAAWGEPINQHDMLATSLLFSEVFVDGLRRFGVRVSKEEGADWLHLWRWASVVLGVEPNLLPVTEEEAVRLILLVRETQEPPDDDSRRLVRGVLESEDARRFPGGSWLAEGFCRALLGRQLADGLGLPDTPAKHAVRAASLVIGPVDRLRAANRWMDEAFVRLGRRYWKALVVQSAHGATLSFAPPQTLARPA